MSYALVGAFVLVLGAVLIAGALWLAAGGALHKKVDLYLAIEDESVAGLNLNAPVKYNGVAVGKVRKITLDPRNPERVRLIFAIDRGTPINVDTEAVLKTQGLTGIAYVELAGGTRDAAPLLAVAPEIYPLIRTKASLSARLENVLTSVLAKLDRTSGNIDSFLGEENRAAFKSALADIAVLSRTFAARKGTIDSGLASAARTLAQADRVTAQLGPVVARLGPAAEQLAPLLERIGHAADAVQTLGNEATLASTSARKAADGVGAEVQRFGADTLPDQQRLLSGLNELSSSLRRLSEQTERDPAGLLFGRSPVPDGPGESATALRRP